MSCVHLNAVVLWNDDGLERVDTSRVHQNAGILWGDEGSETGRFGGGNGDMKGPFTCV